MGCLHAAAASPSSVTDCAGVWTLRQNEWVVSGPSQTWNSVDFGEGMWSEYDEDAGEPVSITDLESRFDTEKTSGE